MSESSFSLNVEKIRRQAYDHVESGARKPETKRGDTIVQLLNDALATEIVCTLRYQQNAVTARGLQSPSVVEEFREHARAEWRHATQIAERIDQLGGEPNFNPLTLSDRSHTDYSESEDLLHLVRENLLAERIVVETYRAIIAYLEGQNDPTTRRLMEQILEEEEEHADELAKLIETIHSVN